MSLYLCADCGCIENTALSNYWASGMDGAPRLCSECDPDIGVWHGSFAKTTAEGMYVDQKGHLWSEIETMPSAYRVVGVVRIINGDTKVVPFGNPVYGEWKPAGQERHVHGKEW